MEPISFQDITQQCYHIIDDLNRSSNKKNTFSFSILKKLYSNFTFELFFYQNEKNINKYLKEYFQKFKFVVVKISKIPKNIFEGQKQGEITNTAFICVENKCFIIENIEISIIDLIFDKNESDVIDISDRTIENEPIFGEITSFCQIFNFLRIDKSKFINYSIKVISTYMIRRFFYPTNFFKDPSFFNFDGQINSQEEEIQSKLKEICQTKEDVEKKNKIEAFQNEIKAKIKENRFSNGLSQKIYNFDINKIKVLRTLNTSIECDVSFNLVIHLDTFYIFMYKKISLLQNNTHEIEFNKKYSHRCFTRFYGNLYDDDQKIGFIYEFMSNGSISNFFERNSNKSDILFSFLTMLRLFQGIKYLHSNNLIHRDLNPSNILINHDFIPFISDFETIREIRNEKNLIDEKFTRDFASSIYASPEQVSDGKISYPTDIYSFGAIIFYLFEKKDMIQVDKNLNFQKSNIYNEIKEEKIFEMINCSPTIEYIYKSSVKYKADDRIKLNDIENEISKEINNFYYIENFLKEGYDQQKMPELIQYLQENIIIQRKDLNTFNNFIKHIFNFTIFSLMSEENKSNLNIKIGDIYYDGEIVEKNYIKAREYYEISSKLNNSDAFLKIGLLYYDGLGVEKSFLKAKEYYEKSANLKNSKSLNALGYLYLDGEGVEQNFQKAKECFELSAELNNSYAYINIGDLYFKGQGVIQDYTKAKEYYELSAKLNNSEAYVHLGNLYFNGEGVPKDYLKAKENYEIAALQNNSAAFINLGHIYLNGFDVEQDITVAEFYYNSAAELNNSEALNILGSLYLDGKYIDKDYEKAKTYFEKAAELNSPDAYTNLGIMYINGIGVEKDYSLSKYYFELSAQQNNSVGLLNLGNLYYYGHGVERNISISLRYYELSAKQNNPLAYFNLGNIYLNGQYVQQNCTIAFHYFEKAANLNCSQAYLVLGDLYFKGQGTQQNFTKAIEYYELAAKNNDIRAIQNLSNMYLYGQGVPCNLSKAKEYMDLYNKIINPSIVQNMNQQQNNTKASEEKDPVALLNLGNLYFNGFGVEQNYSKAREYYELSAQQNDSNAFLNLGNLYFNGFGVEKNYLKAKEYFELSAQQNNPAALYNLGNIYFYGFGVEKNYSKAREYYELSAQLNNSNALMILGNFYFNGFGVEQNYSKAKEYYELSAQQNNSNALFCLGNLYFNGFGVEQNYSKAKEYYELSAQQNNSDAFLNLGNLYFNGFGVKQNYSKAKEYYEFSAQQNNSDAFACLGKLYFNGLGVEQNYSKAKEYFELSAKKNNATGLYCLGNLYFNGLGVERNYSKARVYFVLSAQQQNSDAFLFLGHLYLKGLSVKQSYSKAKEYFEISAKQNNSNAFLLLGELYLVGLGVEQSYEKAFECFKSSANLNNSFALNTIGVYYMHGLGNVKQDYKEAKTYFEKSSKLNNPISFYNLANIYAKGLGLKADILLAKHYYKLACKYKVSDAFNGLSSLYYSKYGKKKLSKAKKCLEIAVELKNPLSMYFLGLIYYNGYKEKQNISKAVYYFELSTKYNIFDSFPFLGIIYLYGIDVKQDLLKGKYYLEVSAKKNYPISLYTLGSIFSSGELFEKDLEKAIDYHLECIKVIDNKDSVRLIGIEDYSLINDRPNLLNWPYFSSNDLGLIYLFEFNEVKKAEEYIKQAAFAEFPFAQYVFGLLNYFNLNNIGNAEYMMNRASKNNFSLADYFLGHIRKEEKIQFYIKASDHQDESITFRDINFFDTRLEISKIFILSMVNLKLVKYFFSKSQYEESKKYFIRSLSKFNLKDKSYHFEFKFDNNNVKESFAYLKSFILDFPLFDPKKNPNYFLVSNFFKEDKNEPKNDQKSKINKSNNKSDKSKKEFLFFKDSNDFESKENKEKIFNDSGELFDFILQNKEVKDIFIKEIKDIVHTMNDMLYEPPYMILFGRISIDKMKEIKKTELKDIDESFYEGFSINLENTNNRK